MNTIFKVKYDYLIKGQEAFTTGGISAVRAENIKDALDIAQERIPELWRSPQGSTQIRLITVTSIVEVGELLN